MEDEANRMNDESNRRDEKKMNGRDEKRSTTGKNERRGATRLHAVLVRGEVEPLVVAVVVLEPVAPLRLVVRGRPALVPSGRDNMYVIYTYTYTYTYECDIHVFVVIPGACPASSAAWRRALTGRAGWTKPKDRRNGEGTVRGRGARSMTVRRQQRRTHHLSIMGQWILQRSPMSEYSNSCFERGCSKTISLSAGLYLREKT